MANNLKGYDANQVLRSVFDVDKNTLRVSIIDGSSGGGSFEVVITHENDSIRLGDGTNFITSTTIGPKTGLDVAVINEVDIEDLNAAKDNVAIQDADGDQLAINPDGSLNTKPGGTPKAFFNEVTSVANGMQTTIITQMISAVSRLQKVRVSGTNVAMYEVLLNNIVIDKKRTYFGSSLNEEFDFGDQVIQATWILSVRVTHERPDVGDFNARIQVVEE